MTCGVTADKDWAMFDSGGLGLMLSPVDVTAVWSRGA